MNAITKFFHQLFNPHCQHCHDEARENRECPNCEVLRQLLESERYDKKQLLEHVIAPREIIKEVFVNKEQPKPLHRSVPWRIRQQELEKADREAASILARETAQPVKSVETLETELGVVSNE